MFLVNFTNYQFISLYSKWIDVKSVAILNSAVCNQDYRTMFLEKFSMACAELISNISVCFLKPQVFLWFFSLSKRVGEVICLKVSTGFSMEESIFNAIVSTNSNNNIISLDLRSIKVMNEEGLLFIADNCLSLKTLKIDTPDFFKSSMATIKLKASLSTFSVSHQTNSAVINWLLQQNVSLIDTLALMHPYLYYEEKMIYIDDPEALAQIQKNFMNLLSECPSLTSLNIARNWPFLSEVVLDHISLNFSKMISLNINGTGTITDKSFCSMCERLSQLSTLMINRCSKIGINSLSSILDGLPSLTDLRFHRTWYYLSSSFIVKLLFNKFSYITHIDFNYLRFVGQPIPQEQKITWNDFKSYLIPQQNYFYQGDPDINQYMMNEICSSPKTISVLSIGNDVISLDMIKQLFEAHGKQLATLVLKDMSNINRDTITYICTIASCSSLTVLSISRCLCIAQLAVILLLKTSPNLIFLDLHDLSVKDNLCVDIGNNCTKLIRISLSGCKIDLNAIKHLGDHCKFLRDAHFASTNRVFTERDLKKALSNCLMLMICTFNNSYFVNNEGSD